VGMAAGGHVEGNEQEEGDSRLHANKLVLIAWNGNVRYRSPTALRGRADLASTCPSPASNKTARVTA
jgi:hypothetical protein